jgi:RNA polymerase sigma-70 factor (ECF subfamily)
MGDQGRDDITLMLAFKGGDEEAFSALLDRYTAPIVNFIYRFTGSRDDAEDLAQEAFLRVYRSAASYQPRSKFSTWLYRIATNVCLDYKRRKKRNPLQQAQPVIVRTKEGEEKEVEPHNASEPAIEVSAEERQRQGEVQDALASLPEKQRLALTLKVYEDKSYQEIADILSVSVPAVESLIFRARQSLKNKLQQP